ncbi:hypothetical protein CLM83_05915 [Streptomyces albidoflavus]|nr:hypothetical protein CLM83_05915 [Streptomyces albidoflavus]
MAPVGTAGVGLCTRCGHRRRSRPYGIRLFTLTNMNKGRRLATRMGGKRGPTPRRTGPEG